MVLLGCSRPIHVAVKNGVDQYDDDDENDDDDDDDDDYDDKDHDDCGRLYMKLASLLDISSATTANRALSAVTW